MGCCTPPLQISKIKESNKRKHKKNTQSSWKGRREKELHVCLVFMCTRVDTYILTNTFLQNFLSKFSSSTPPPPFKNFLDLRLYMYVHVHVRTCTCTICTPDYIVKRTLNIVQSYCFATEFIFSDVLEHTSKSYQLRNCNHDWYCGAWSVQLTSCSCVPSNWLWGSLACLLLV